MGTVKTKRGGGRDHMVARDFFLCSEGAFSVIHVIAYLYFIVRVLTVNSMLAWLVDIKLAHLAPEKKKKKTVGRVITHVSRV